MQLARFRLFVSRLRASNRLQLESKGLTVYRISPDSAWVDDTGAACPDALLVARLTDVLATGLPKRQRKSTDVLVPVSFYRAVVRITTAVAARQRTIARLTGYVSEVAQQAREGFDASHDVLTGLLNGPSFETHCQALMVPPPAPAPAESTDDAASASASTAYTLFAVDIDRFKQVNDTHGHLYGDAVIRCLARRLAQVVDQHTTGDIVLLVSRPSGEEFLVFARGLHTSEAALAVAEQLRNAVGSTPLPSDAEWASETRLHPAQLVKLPPLADRKITVSIGIASEQSVSDAEAGAALSRLRAQADQALYTAKAGGRDCARHFDDILDKYGRLLEHQRDTDIAVIDIGLGVGVVVGQEFLAFHPQCDGSVPYVFADGRTQRVLGRWPRVHIARLVVFDVQQDISFCRVVERYPASLGTLPSGCTLEAVAVGSISHLVTGGALAGAWGPGLLGAKEMRDRLEAAVKRGESVGVIVIGLDREDDVSKKHGRFFVNECLARLYEAGRLSFGAAAHWAQVRPTEFAVLIEKAGVDQSQVQAAMASAAQACDGVASFSAGHYTSLVKKGGARTDDGLDPKHALEYARYALVYARTKGGEVVQFEKALGRAIIYAARMARRHAQAIEDYKALKELGVWDWHMANQAALAGFAMAKPDRELMLQTIREARRQDPDNWILAANEGMIVYKHVSRPEAIEAFVKARELNDGVLTPPYRGPAALAAFAKHSADPASIERETVLEWIKEAMEPEVWQAGYVSEGEVRAAWEALGPPLGTEETTKETEPKA